MRSIWTALDEKSKNIMWDYLFCAYCIMCMRRATAEASTYFRNLRILRFHRNQHFIRTATIPFQIPREWNLWNWHSNEIPWMDLDFTSLVWITWLTSHQTWSAAKNWGRTRRKPSIWGMEWRNRWVRYIIWAPITTVKKRCHRRKAESARTEKTKDSLRTPV